MVTTSRLPRLALAVPFVVAGLLLTGCGSGSSGGSSTGTGSAPASTPSTTSPGSSASGPAAAAAVKVPDAITQKGSITVGVNAIFAPMEYTEAGSTTLKGFDIEFANAIGKALDIPIKFDNQQFNQLIPSLATGRVDMVLSGITDNKKREEAQDFIDYFKTGTQVYVLARRASEVKTLASLCGQTMAMSASTDYVTTMENWSKANCVANGKSAIKILGVDSEPSARLQMAQNRAIASAISPEVLGYLNTQQKNAYTAVGEILDPGPYGIAFNKSNTQLRDAVMAAVQQTFADGSYKALLAKWNLTPSALESPTLNQATS